MSADSDRPEEFEPLDEATIFMLRNLDRNADLVLVDIVRRALARNAEEQREEAEKQRSAEDLPDAVAPRSNKPMSSDPR